MLRHPTVEFESQPVVCIPRNLWWYSPECLELFTTFPGMFGDIPQNDWWHSPEYLATFPGIFGDIPRNVWRHSPKCLATFPGIQHSPYSPRSPHSVPSSCIPGFIYPHFTSQLNNLWEQKRHKILKNMPTGSFWVLKVSFIKKNVEEHLQNVRV